MGTLSGGLFLHCFQLRVYEPLRLPGLGCAMAGRLPKRFVVELPQGNQEHQQSKPATSNGLYTLLAVVNLVIIHSLLYKMGFLHF